MMNTGKDSQSKEKLLEIVLPALRVVSGPDSKGEHVCWCPFHPDGEGKPPHRPNLYVSERGFKCHACGASGSLYQLCNRLELTVQQGSPSPDQKYSYTDANGQLLYQVVRSPGKKFRQRRPDGSGGWIWNMQGVERVLYRLRDLRASSDSPVFIVEGEKDADRLVKEGLTATTNSGGAGKWRDSYSVELQGRDVIILPDNDDAGRRHAKMVVESLKGASASVRILELPDLAEKGDVSDWLDAGHTLAELTDLVRSSPSIEPHTPQNFQAPTIQSGGQSSQADRLVQLALRSGAVLFHDTFGEPFGRIPIEGHLEIHLISGSQFKTWLNRLLWESESKVPSRAAVVSATDVLEAMATFSSAEIQLHNRVARKEGDIWVDLSDSERRAVRITPEGWEIVPSPPILFRQYTHQRPQVTPEKGGDLHSLLGFINITDPGQQLLFLVHVVSSFIPDVSHPIFLPHGPQGSGKSSVLRLVKAIVDPSLIPLLNLPKSIKQLGQQLSHHWAPMYDNISSISREVSDFLCSAVTGASSLDRKLFTNDEAFIRAFQGCICLNGINIVAEQPDLLDRTILYGLEKIEDTSRSTDNDLMQEFEQVKPKLLGAIFDVISRAQDILPSIRQTSLPRMADFAKWGCAITEALGYDRKMFLNAYEKNREIQHFEALDANAIGAAVLQFMENRDYWKGTPTELFLELNEVARNQGIRTSSQDWPKAPNALSRKLSELEVNLKAVGYHLELGDRTSKKRFIEIVRESAEEYDYLADDLGYLELKEVLNEIDETDIVGKVHSNPGERSPKTPGVQMTQRTLFSDFEGRNHRDPG